MGGRRRGEGGRGEEYLDLDEEDSDSDGDFTELTRETTLDVVGDRQDGRKTTARTEDG
jgi:hypothetical protein